ncbi:CHAT domain-containing protein [Actinoplanes sp. NPDC026619]|uniref:CHAT domain-containing protein n=1 Tax=Actinoplanes sp. NPDC026619 TaxID=3155798 RepID=UPI0033CC15DA
MYEFLELDPAGPVGAVHCDDLSRPACSAFQITPDFLLTSWDELGRYGSAEWRVAVVFDGFHSTDAEHVDHDAGLGVALYRVTTRAPADEATIPLTRVPLDAGREVTVSGWWPKIGEWSRVATPTASGELAGPAVRRLPSRAYAGAPALVDTPDGPAAAGIVLAAGSFGRSLRVTPIDRVVQRWPLLADLLLPPWHPLAGDPAEPDAAAIAEFVAEHTRGPFTGREAEPAALSRWWDDPDAPPVAIVTGSPGSGASTLLAHWAGERARQGGVAFVPCDPAYGLGAEQPAMTALLRRIERLRGRDTRPAERTEAARRFELIKTLSTPAPAGGRLLVVVDNDPRAGFALGARHLPERFGDGVRLLLSMPSPADLGRPAVVVGLDPPAHAVPAQPAGPRSELAAELLDLLALLPGPVTPAELRTLAAGIGIAGPDDDFDRAFAELAPVLRRGGMSGSVTPAGRRTSHEVLRERVREWGLDVLADLRAGVRAPADTPAVLVRHLGDLLAAAPAGQALPGLYRLVHPAWREAWEAVTDSRDGFGHDVRRAAEAIGAINVAAVEAGRPAPYLAEQVHCSVSEADADAGRDGLTAQLAAALVRRGRWSGARALAFLEQRASLVDGRAAAVGVIAPELGVAEIGAARRILRDLTTAYVPELAEATAGWCRLLHRHGRTLEAVAEAGWLPEDHQRHAYVRAYALATLVPELPEPSAAAALLETLRLLKSPGMTDGTAVARHLTTVVSRELAARLLTAEDRGIPDGELLAAIDPSDDLSRYPDLHAHVMAAAAPWFGDDNRWAWTQYYLDDPSEVYGREEHLPAVVGATAKQHAIPLLALVRKHMRGPARLYCLAQLLPVLDGPYRESVLTEMRDRAGEIRGLQGWGAQDFLAPGYRDAGLIDDGLDLIGRPGVEDRDRWLTGLAPGMSVAQAERALEVADLGETDAAVALARRGPLARLADLDPDRALALLRRDPVTPELRAAAQIVLSDDIDRPEPPLATPAPDVGLGRVTDDGLRLAAVVGAAALRPETTSELAAAVTSFDDRWMLSEYLCAVVPLLPGRSTAKGVVDLMAELLSSVGQGRPHVVAAALYRRRVALHGAGAVRQDEDPAELAANPLKAVGVAGGLAGVPGEENRRYLREVAAHSADDLVAAAVLAATTGTAGPEVLARAAGQVHWHDLGPVVQQLLRNLDQAVRPDAVRALLGPDWSAGITGGHDDRLDLWAEQAAGIAFALDREQLAALAAKTGELYSGTIRNQVRAGLAEGYAVAGDDDAAYRYVDEIGYDPARLDALQRIGAAVPASRLPRWFAEAGLHSLSDRARLWASVAHRWTELPAADRAAVVTRLLARRHADRADLLVDVIGCAPALLRLGPPGGVVAIRETLGLGSIGETRERLVAALNERLDEFQRDLDPAVLFDRATTEIADRLRGTLEFVTVGVQVSRIEEGFPLGIFYWQRYQAAGGADDYEAARQFLGALARRLPERVPAEVRAALDLDGVFIEPNAALELLMTVRAIRDAGRLDEAITALREGMSGFDDIGRDSMALVMAEMLRDQGNLVEAEALVRGVVTGTDAGSDRHRLALRELDHVLVLREAAGESITAQLVDARRQLAAVLPPGPDRAEVLLNIGAALREPGRPQPIELLTEIADVLRDAVREAGDDHPHLAGFANNLAEVLIQTYQVRGAARAALDEAIDLLRGAEQRIAPDAPYRVGLLVNLGNALRMRDGRADLAAANGVAREAVELSDADSRDGRNARRLLFRLLLDQYGKTRDAGLVEEMSAVLAQEVEDQAEPDLADYYGRAADLWQELFDADGGLGQCLHFGVSRGGHGRPDFLAQAIAAIGQALDRTAVDDLIERSLRLTQQNRLLRNRFQITGDTESLGEAVRAGEEALRAAPDEMRQATARLSLGDTLATRYYAERRPADLIAAVTIFGELMDSPVLSVFLRLGVAGRFGGLAHLAGDPAAGLRGYELAVGLVPQLVWRGLDAADRTAIVANLGGLSSGAAACAIAAGRPDRALELLEQGRAVLWGQRRELRADISALAAGHPAEAARLAELSDTLDRSADNDTEIIAYGSIVTAADPADRIRLAHQWDEAVEAVRSLPGLAGFLRPQPASELRTAAAGGAVVVVNVDSDRCDALLVAEGGVESVPLPDLTIAALMDHVNALHVPSAGGRDGGWRDLEPVRDGPALDDTLAWLWTAVAEPVLDALGHTAPPAPGEPWPRVWWCPTRWLSFLPLHAAGRPGHRADTVLDRVVSSYAPSLGALLASRRRPPASSLTAPVLIAMPETPGATGLAGVDREIAVLTEMFPQVRRFRGAEATRAAVLDALPGAPWLHLACHGAQDLTSPTEGRILLHDGNLRLRDLSALRLPGAELAFASACHTSRGGLSVPDEGLTVAAALQLAGFRHVIGTLWAIADSEAPTLARDVYASLRTPSGGIGTTDTAQALHEAVRGLRERFPRQPVIWSPYVHIGP